MRSLLSPKGWRLLVMTLPLFTSQPALPQSVVTNEISSPTISAFELKDQFDDTHVVSFPRTNVMVLTVADWKGSEEINDWVAPLKKRYGHRIHICGVANLGKVPSLLRRMVKAKFKKRYTYPIMLNWNGRIAERLGFEKNQASVLVIDHNGDMLLHLSGYSSEQRLGRIFKVIDDAIDNSKPTPASKQGKSKSTL